jgi:hypothetical protein
MKGVEYELRQFPEKWSSSRPLQGIPIARMLTGGNDVKMKNGK